jgi:hypothetical protein
MGLIKRWQDHQDLKAEEAALDKTMKHWSDQGGYGKAAAAAQAKENAEKKEK